MIDIPEWEGFYAITRDGEVWSHPTQHRDGVFIKSSPDKDGYLQIRLRKGGMDKTTRIHQLVAKTYIPNPDNKPTVNHKNKIITDNRVENLEWATRGEQLSHSWGLGRKYTEKTRIAFVNVQKLSSVARRKKVMQLTREGILCKIYESLTEASSITGISVPSICHALKSESGKAGGYGWQYA